MLLDVCLPIFNCVILNYNTNLYQNAPEDVRSRNMRRDLEERERAAYRDRGDKRSSDRPREYKRQRIEANLDADDPVDSVSLMLILQYSNYDLTSPCPT